MTADEKFKKVDDLMSELKLKGVVILTDPAAQQSDMTLIGFSKMEAIGLLEVSKFGILREGEAADERC